MIILSTVAIIALVGEKGIIVVAQNAKQEYEINQAKEKIQVAIMDYQANRKEYILYKYLEKIQGIESIVSKNPEDNTQGPPFTVVVDGYEFYIDEELNIEYKTLSRGIVPKITKIEHKLKNEREVTIQVEAKTEDNQGLKKAILLTNGIIIDEREINGKNIQESFDVTSNGEYTIIVVAKNGKQISSEIITITEIDIFNGIISPGTVIDASVKLSVHGESTKQKITKVEVYANNTKKDEKIYTDGTNELDEQFIIQELPFYENVKCYALLIDENGNTKATNEITVKNNKEIANLVDLRKMASEVNNGNTFNGETVRLIANIVTQSNWIPIGCYTSSNEDSDYSFDGTFDGNNKEISNISINNNENQTVGLFGFVGTEGTIKNLTVSGKIIQDNLERAGGGVVRKK